MEFDKNKFCDEHREWAYLREYLEDRPTQDWTIFSINEKNNTTSKTSRTSTSKSRTRKNK
jgi:hypothetical protein